MKIQICVCPEKKQSYRKKKKCFQNRKIPGFNGLQSPFRRASAVYRRRLIAHRSRREAGRALVCMYALNVSLYRLAHVKKFTSLRTKSFLPHEMNEFNVTNPDFFLFFWLSFSFSESIFFSAIVK